MLLNSDALQERRKRIIGASLRRSSEEEKRRQAAVSSHRILRSGIRKNSDDQFVGVGILTNSANCQSPLPTIRPELDGPGGCVRSFCNRFSSEDCLFGTCGGVGFVSVPATLFIALSLGTCTICPSPSPPPQPAMRRLLK